MSSYFESRKISPEFYKNYKLPYYISSRLPKSKKVSILDFGCGFGQTLLALRDLGYENVMGCDVDDEAIKYCISQGLKVENCSNLDGFVAKYENKFDMVLMLHVLEHFPKTEIIPTLSKINKILKKQGKIIITVPNAQSSVGAYWAYEDFTHELIFTSGSLYYVLKMAGFEEIYFIDVDCTEGLSAIKKIIRKFLLKIYKTKIHFWNRITCSSFHKQSPEIYSWEIKVLAVKK
jgi:2-polyprenyl-3-methyl-5-hydroxy-6-metoxy-1,4-benzoquinol methylase